MTRILRRASRPALAAILALAMTLSLASVPAEARQDLGAEQQFISLINADRDRAGLQPLTPVGDVRAVALDWSRTMASQRRMYHNPDYSRQFCCWFRAAENVGWTTVSDMGDASVVAAAVRRLHTAFMDSKGHRDNIMHPAHDQIGLAIELRADSCPDGVGIRDCMWVTENFRHWDGTQPAGGLTSPYATSTRDVSGDGPASVTVSDRVHRGGFDGDVRTVERLGATANSAIQVSRARFGADQARHAILSRNDRFPDSLAGTPLTADGPLLMTPSSRLSSAVRAELQRVLEPGATVYLLGGEAALSKAVDRAVRQAGLTPRRLAGATRVDTAIVVANEVRRVYGDNGTVAIARASGIASDPDGPTGWVDSVTGGAWAARRGVPVLISPTEALPTNVRRWLAADGADTTILFGGQSALSDRVLAAVDRGARIWGQDRTDTAAAVAKRLWGVSPDSSDRQFVLIDGWARNAWRHGLAAAGLAADAGAPMLLTSAQAWDQPTSTTAMVQACTTPSVDLLLVGSLRDSVAGTLESLDGRAC